MSTRRALILGAVIGIAGTLAITGFVLPWVSNRHSDVPVISDIGGWAYQNGVRVDQVRAAVIDGNLGLFNHYASVRFRVTGTVSALPYWRPYVESVQMSQRIGSAATSRPYGDVELVPVIGVKQDASYSGQAVPFDVSVEHSMSSLNWGPNNYVVVAGDKRAEFGFLQPK